MYIDCQEVHLYNEQTKRQLPIRLRLRSRNKSLGQKGCCRPYFVWDRLQNWAAATNSQLKVKPENGVGFGLRARLDSRVVCARGPKGDLVFQLRVSVWPSP